MNFNNFFRIVVVFTDDALVQVQRFLKFIGYKIREMYGYFTNFRPKVEKKIKKKSIILVIPYLIGNHRYQKFKK